mgnify:CR=1 FL=1
MHLTKEASRGDFVSHLPENRTWQFDIHNVSEPTDLSATIDGRSISVQSPYNPELKILSVDAHFCPNTSKLEVILDGISLERYESSPVARIQRLIQKAKLPSIVKQQFMRRLPELMINP